MSDDFEFEDDEPVKKDVKAAAPVFDAFADEDVGSAQEEPAPASAPESSPEKTSPSSPGAKADFDAFADVGEEDPDADSAADAEIKPGQGKDLWTCLHCQSKNKPNRDTCRKCGKTAEDEVIIPLFSRPPVKFGAIGGAVFIVLMVIMSALTVDVSLPAVGADAMGEDYTNNGVRIAGSGRIFKLSTAADTCSVTVAFGYQCRDDKVFNKLRYSVKNNELTRGAMGGQKFLILKLSKSNGALSDFAKGKYIAFSVAYSLDGETDSEQNIYAIDESDVEFIVANE
ncbi:MAG: hypothetical protein HRU15_18260 [Planctomycetes bacterium]|nr:hypothetical protein [Planctomycetota bacterium]